MKCRLESLQGVIPYARSIRILGLVDTSIKAPASVPSAIFTPLNRFRKSFRLNWPIFGQLPPAAWGHVHADGDRRYPVRRTLDDTEVS